MLDLSTYIKEPGMTIHNPVTLVLVDGRDQRTAPAKFHVLIGSLQVESVISEYPASSFGLYILTHMFTNNRHKHK